MATITDGGGTWTAIPDFSGEASGGIGQSRKGLNVPDLRNIDLQSFRGGASGTNENFGPSYPEFDQFIQLMAIGLNIHYWQAVALLELFLKAKLNQEGPTVSTVFAG